MTASSPYQHYCNPIVMFDAPENQTISDVCEPTDERSLEPYTYSHCIPVPTLKDKMQAYLLVHFCWFH